jgi:DAK2 domain fusion protein YloV
MAITDRAKVQRLMRLAPGYWYQCDGQGLKRLAAAGLGWLERHYETVNALNVFPVPDGDTGINMLLTMRNAWSEIVNSAEDDVGAIASMLAKGAVMGSRGNSGVILSQLWLGFASGVEGMDTFDANGMAQAFRSASESADNVRGMKPVEGTILTVARDGAKAAEAAAQESTDLRYIMEQVVAEMHRSVERTPELLVKNGVYVLKEAGVVDSGGLGLAFILEGMLHYLNGKSIELSGEEVGEPTQELRRSDIDLSGLDYPYDVQFLLSGDNLDIDTITTSIEGMGDSALVVGDAKTLKVHVHVVNPGEPLGFAAQMGALSDIVVENMQEQYQEFVLDRDGTAAAQPVEVRPPEIKEGDVAAIVVAPGEGLERIFYSLGAAKVVSGGQTMNPSTVELIAASASLPTDEIILLPNNKNILMAAEQAAEHTQDKAVRVVPSRTIPQGVSALLTLDSQGDLEAVTEGMSSALGSVETGEITTATRSVTIDDVKVKKGQFIGLHNDALRVGGDSIEAVMQALLTEMEAADLELITLYYGNSVSAAEAQTLAEMMGKQYSEQEFEVVEGGQPHYHYILSAE